MNLSPGKFCLCNTCFFHLLFFEISGSGLLITCLTEGCITPGVKVISLLVDVKNVTPAKPQILDSIHGRKQQARIPCLVLLEAPSPKEHMIGILSLFLLLYALSMQAGLSNLFEICIPGLDDYTRSICRCPDKFDFVGLCSVLV